MLVLQSIIDTRLTLLSVKTLPEPKSDSIFVPERSQAPDIGVRYLECHCRTFLDVVLVVYLICVYNTRDADEHQLHGVYRDGLSSDLCSCRLNVS